MFRIKNLKGGWLFITDASLKFKSGQAALVESLFTQTQELIVKFKKDRRWSLSKITAEAPTASPLILKTSVLMILK